MTPSPKKISYRNGDRTSTPLMMLLFLVIAIGLHLLFALCFHSEPAEQDPVPQQQRTIRMIATEDINTRSPGYRLADPTVFVHGAGGTGYSQTDWDDDDRKPELPIDAVPEGLTVPEESTEIKITAPERGELPHISANASLLGAPSKERNAAAEKQELIYPVWLDLSGNLLNGHFSEKQLADLKALNIKGQTTFRITPSSNSKLQYHVTLLRSCGTAAGDVPAKIMLEKALTDPDFRNRVSRKDGFVIRLCWSQFVETPQETELPDMMFPDQKSSGKGTKK